MREKAKPTKEQFQDYVRVQMSGITNMFNVDLVCSLSDHGLKPEHCFYIFSGDNYSMLKEEYGV